MTVLMTIMRMQQKHNSNTIQECKQASFIQSKISFEHPETFNRPKTWRNNFKS